MTIRQIIASTYAIAAIAIAGIFAAPAIAAFGDEDRVPVLLTEEILNGEALTGHAEIDDWPAYMTDEVAHADR